jgi:hypothetical protein
MIARDRIAPTWAKGGLSGRCLTIDFKARFLQMDIASLSQEDELLARGSLIEPAKEDHIAIWGDHQTLWFSLWQGHRAAADEDAIRPAPSFKERQIVFLFRSAFQIQRRPHLRPLRAVLKAAGENSQLGARVSLPVWRSHTAAPACSSGGSQREILPRGMLIQETIRALPLERFIA